MYTIRVDTAHGLLEIELSGRLVTSEALRAMSQAFAIAEAGTLTTTLCDVRELDRGPASSMVVAAALAVRFQPGSRLAFVARQPQLRFLQRVIRFSGIREGVLAFPAREEAETWLLPSMRAARRPRSTERRHAEQVLGHHPAPAISLPRREAAVLSAESRPPAA
ncbi:MAG: hypothetical protein HUU14_07155 [Dehalococcoidia bacterium]|nr:hypothetical protein [Chloroflexi bacterium CFX7]MCK6563926.1 hypothetical protein [Dehalococcoidia bacterium]NUQ55644.1 hypothetical protein [Dehalococcoidia bacterium]RIL02625.1 MAG: hypothetical protein DCC78_06140 [bacterium]